MRQTGEMETHETERREGDSCDKTDRRKLMRRTGVKETHETNRTEGKS
jgi:hypothetical protein